ncbi:hypothetical protein CRUP_000408, partial [Coryphaenoides rupestris]
MSDSAGLQFVSPYAFEAMQKVDVVCLAALSDPELRLLLPCLVRMALCAPADQSQAWAQDKKLILRLLSGVEAVNSIVALLSVDFHALEQDARKEQQLSILVSQLQHGLTLEFEHSDPLRRLRLALSELLAIMNKVVDSNGEFFLKSSELFESPVYLEEVADVLCILQADWFLCLLVANVPDSFNEVCRGLIKNGELQDEESQGGRRRTEALRQLCQMNPSEALNIRAMVVEECHLPGLGVALTLDYRPEVADEAVSPLVAYVSGLLLGTNGKVRTWFSMFIRNGQQRKREGSSVLWQMRRQLLLELVAILPRSRSARLPEQPGGGASRDEEPGPGYSGLREEHVLMTSRPPATPAGVRFVSLSFCKLLAFPMLVSTPEQEQLMVMWLSWMIKEEEYFERPDCRLQGGVAVVAIVIKPSSLSKMKTIFTQEIFTEQLCETTTPLHTQLLPLIDAYVNSILTPASKTNPEATNQPITEQEILCVFQNPAGVTLMQKKPRCYSAALMDHIPIKFLVTQAQKLQQELGGLHSALLRLLATNYPHLCLVEDWVCEEEVTGTLPLLRRMMLSSNTCRYSPEQLHHGRLLPVAPPPNPWPLTPRPLAPPLGSALHRAFQKLPSSGPWLTRALEQLALLSPGALVPYAEPLTTNMCLLLEPARPVSSMMITTAATAQEVDQHRISTTATSSGPTVLVCPPLIDIILHMLSGYLLASKAFLHGHLKETADFERQNQTVSSLGLAGQPDTPEVTREELKNALLAAQDSAAVQILLEVCMPTLEELQVQQESPAPPLPLAGRGRGRGLPVEEEAEPEAGLLSDLREGYPPALLPLTVAGIPSIHICLDFIPELLAQPQLEKQ